jgi:hypothetical protein
MKSVAYVFKLNKKRWNMKRIKVLLIVTMISLTTMIMYGCGKEEAEYSSEEQEKEELEVEKDDFPDAEVDDENSVASTVTKMKIYYADSETGEIVCNEVESDQVTPEVIWKQLQEQDVISKECGLNQYSFHETEKKMDIDVNTAFGTYIRNMGTTGEDIVITCITRTYLETYGFEKIKITEDGKVLETGHAVLDGYIGNE